MAYSPGNPITQGLQNGVTVTKMIKMGSMAVMKIPKSKLNFETKICNVQDKQNVRF